MRIVLATVIVSALVSCGRPDKYHLKIENPLIRDAIIRFIDDYSQTRERFIVQVFLVSTTCKGTEIVLSAALPVQSSILSCPAQGFDTVCNHLVVIYGGIGTLEKQDFETYVRDVFAFFPIQDLENDWDAKANEPQKTYTYNPPIRGIRIRNDSLMHFNPENGWYFYPCIYCE